MGNSARKGCDGIQGAMLVNSRLAFKALRDILSIVFLVLPFVALYGVSKDQRIGYWALGLFPIVAFVFGVTAIPFVKFFYGTNVMVNSYLIGAVNIAVVISAVWLYKAGGLRSNQSLKSGTPQSGAP